MLMTGGKFLKTTGQVSEIKTPFDHIFQGPSSKKKHYVCLCIDFFTKQQLFIILEFEFGGVDLENSNGMVCTDQQLSL